MTVKSNVKLDARIKSMNDVQTCLRYDDSYIGERGYFASDLCDLSDLSGSCAHGTLAQIILDGVGDDIFRTPHDVEHGNWGSRFFVPERLLKPVEKKYRPFSIEEFLNIFDVGDLIEFRRKNNDEIKHVQFIGYVENDIMIGIYRFSLSHLFENYDLYFEDEWQVFGVEVKEE